jgi:hypothetical protein
MSLQPKPHLSFEDWLEGERAALEGRSEYVGGEVFAMTGASVAHNAIVGNIFGQLWTQMKGRPCQVYANDLKVRIRSANAGKYPDQPFQGANALKLHEIIFLAPATRESRLDNLTVGKQNAMGNHAFAKIGGDQVCWAKFSRSLSTRRPSR